MMLVLGASVLCQLGAAALCVRFFWVHGRRWVWASVCILALLSAFYTALQFHHFAPGLPVFAAMRDTALCTLALSALLVAGLLAASLTLRATAQTEELLRRQKRHLSLLVDRRVADLEVEVQERARAEDQLRRDSDRFAAIISTQQEIATAELDLSAVLNLVVIRAQELAHASSALIEMCEEGGLVSRAACGRTAAYIGVKNPGRGLSVECLKTGQSLRCNDAETDSRVDLSFCRRVGARSLIAVPLHYGREVVGVLEVQSPELYAFGPADVHTLQLMAGLIGAAMSHHAEFEAKQALLQEAIERAEHDPLTGLLNHRAFHKRLHEEADRAQREGKSLAMAVIDMDNFKFFNDVYGHPVGDDVLRRVASALAGACRSYDVLSRFGGDEFAVLMPCVTTREVAELTERLASCLDGVEYRPSEYESTIPLSLSVGVAVFPDEAPTRLEVLELADTRLRRVKYGASEGIDITEYLRSQLSCSMANFSILNALVTAVDNKDRYTRRHSEDVMNYAVALAKDMELDEEAQKTVRIAALLHDVGKIGVPDAILRKPGALTAQEKKAIEQHPMMGAIIVGAVPGFVDTLDAIRHHHERWDGNGYPFALRGPEIPLLGRILAVADSYSAMTTDRPYRKGMDEARALSILEAGAGLQWDAACVTAFVNARRFKPALPSEDAAFAV